MTNHEVASDKSKFVLIVNYDFKERADRDAWVEHFTNLQNDDGIRFTHECSGGAVRLLQFVNEEGAEAEEINATKVTIYEEWNSKQDLLDCFGKRMQSGFIPKWFGLEPSTGKWTKMKEDKLTSWELSLTKTNASANASNDVSTPPSSRGPHVVLIHYDFKELSDCDEWYEYFTDDENADGFWYTANFEGSRVCKLLKGFGDDNSTIAAFYEEWDSQEAQIKYGMERARAGFMAKWLGVDMETFKWEKLKHEKPTIMRMEVIAELG